MGNYRCCVQFSAWMHVRKRYSHTWSCFHRRRHSDNGCEDVWNLSKHDLINNHYTGSWSRGLRARWNSGWKRVWRIIWRTRRKGKGRRGNCLKCGGCLSIDNWRLLNSIIFARSWWGLQLVNDERLGSLENNAWKFYFHEKITSSECLGFDGIELPSCWSS